MGSEENRLVRTSRTSRDSCKYLLMFEAREERLLGSLRRQRIISRLADALTVMDSRLVIRVENMLITSSLEVLGADLNSTMSKYLQLSLFVLTYFLHFPSSEYFNTIKRLCRKLLYMYRQGDVGPTDPQGEQGVQGPVGPKGKSLRHGSILMLKCSPVN